MKKSIIQSIIATSIIVGITVSMSISDTSVIGISGLSRQSNGDITKSIPSDTLDITGKSIFGTISAPIYKGPVGGSVSFQNMSTNYIKASQGVFRNISSHRTASRSFETPFQLFSTATATKLYWHDGNYIKLKLKASTQVSYSSLISNKSSTVTLEVSQDDTGNRTLSYGGNNIHVPGGIAPVLSNVANQKDILEFKWNGNKFNLTNAVFNLYSTPN